MHRVLRSLPIVAALGVGLIPLAAQTPPARYLAVFVTNANVDGQSFSKGYQVEALRYDNVTGKVIVNDAGRTLRIPGNYVRVLPEDKMGITVIRASYSLSGQNPKNVTAQLQKKLDGQQKATIVVSAAQLGIRSSAPQNQAFANAGSMPNMQGQGMPRTGGDGQQRMGMGMGGVPANMGQTTMGALEITYGYLGTVRSTAAPEGQVLNLP